MNAKYTNILEEINAMQDVIVNANDQEQNIFDQMPTIDLEVESDWDDNKGYLLNVNRLGDIEDEDEERETREALEQALNKKIDTYRFIVKSCKCEKFLSVKSQNIYNLYKNNTEYCRYCSDVSENHHFVLYEEEAIEGSVQAEEIFNVTTIYKTEENLALLKQCYNL
jgi:hypothetical protein